MEKLLLSKNQLSAELKVDRRTLDKRLDGLRPAKVGARNAQLYALADVFAAFMASAQEEAKQARKFITPEDKAQAADELAAARLRRETADADLAEIKVQRERGILVAAEQVEAIWGSLVASMRAKLLTLPGRAAVQTAGLDTKTVERRLDEMIREALEELSRGAEVEEYESADGN